MPCSGGDGAVKGDVTVVRTTIPTFSIERHGQATRRETGRA
jgi:hypothetical protein